MQSLLKRLPDDYPLFSLPLMQDDAIYRVRVTPEVAERWLEYNRINRFVATATMRLYARRMKQGRWHRNGENIKFSKSGKLLDGQHRLQAVMYSGVTVEFEVHVGLDDHVGLTCDTGRKRSTTDVMGMQGLGLWDARLAAAAINMLINHEQHKMLWATGVSDNEEIADYWQLHGASLYPSLQFIRTLNSKVPIFPLKLALALHFMFKHLAPESDVDDFFVRLYRGNDLPETDPLFVLRAWLTPMLAKRQRTPVFELANACIRAWNLTRMGKPCGKTDTLRRHDGTYRLPEIAS